MEYLGIELEMRKHTKILVAYGNNIKCYITFSNIIIAILRSLNKKNVFDNFLT